MHDEGRPISHPAHFLNSRCLQPFDLEAFLATAATTLVWACPITKVPATVREGASGCPSPSARRALPGTRRKSS